jgi:hypothetical protein
MRVFEYVHLVISSDCSFQKYSCDRPLPTALAKAETLWQVAMVGRELSAFLVCTMRDIEYNVLVSVLFFFRFAVYWAGIRGSAIILERGNGWQRT